jgi:hypothetical protein
MNRRQERSPGRHERTATDARLLTGRLLDRGRAAVILSTRRIYEFQRRVEGRQLANMKNWNPFYKFSMSLRQQLSPEFLIFNIRACGAFMILFAIILLAIN